MIHRLAKPRRYMRHSEPKDEAIELPIESPAGVGDYSDKLKSPRLKEILKQPVGTPIKLTREEALEIIEAGMGGRPDFPPGEDFVRAVRRKGRKPSRGA